MNVDNIHVHNVGELVKMGDGVLLQRVPEPVRTALNDTAQTKYRQPAGVELRFVTDASAVSVTLSAPEGNTLVPYWGPIRGGRTFPIGPEPTTIEVPRPAQLHALGSAFIGDVSGFSTECWRLRFDHQAGPVRYHDIAASEPIGLPPASTVPDRRYVAYGTSITHGNAATGPHLTYVDTTARRLAIDSCNLGTGGSAYCEPELADHIAGLDWDIATLAISVNMLGAGFSTETFRERARYFVKTVAGTGRPVGVITLFPHYRDFSDHDEADLATAYRETVRNVVAELDLPNVVVIEGPTLLRPAEVTADLIHPADEGMIGIGERLATRLDPLLTDT